MKKKFLYFFLIIFLIIGGYFIYLKFVKSTPNVNSMSIIPSDAIYIITSNKPIKSWKAVSKSDAWKHLASHPYFAEIGASAHALDSMIQNNDRMFELFGEREVYISAHKTKAKDYDFLYVVDLAEVSKIDFLQKILDQLFAVGGWGKNTHEYRNNVVSDMRDGATGEILHYTLIGNQLVLSYSNQLVESAINTAEHPEWMNNDYFRDIVDRTNDAGLFKLYINANYFDDWMKCYQEPLDPMSVTLSKIVRFMGTTFDFYDGGFSLNGVMNVNDSVNSYLKAMLVNGSGSIGASEVITADAALYMSFGFKDFSRFFNEFESLLQEDSAKFNTYKHSIRLVEKALNISMKEQLLSWIGDEVAYVMLPPHDSLQVKDYAMFIKTTNIDDCMKQMKLVQKKIKRRTPFRIRKKDYHDHEINGMAAKGLFNILFGKLFDKFEKPYYTFLDDYIIFTNHEETLHKIIDDFDAKKTLAEDPSFKSMFQNFSSASSVFTYMKTAALLPLMKENMSAATFTSLMNNQKFYGAFDQVGFQLKSLGTYFETNLNCHFVSPQNVEHPQPTIDSLPPDTAVIPEAHSATPETIIDEKGHIEKQIGADGKLVYSKSIDDELKAHGKYTEYWPNGEVKVKGHYEHGLKSGTWKYYDEQGKFIRKEEANEEVPLEE